MEKDPSIEYLELYALCAGVLVWEDKLKNRRVILHCDNQSVVDMVNSTSSKCKNCMILIRILVLNNLFYKRRVYVRHISGSKNILADALSRQKFKTFWKYAPSYTKKYPEKLPEQIWPVSKIWVD